MKIPPFKEINPPDKFGYWTNKKTGEKFGGQYISSLLVPNLKRVEDGFFKAMKDKKSKGYDKYIEIRKRNLHKMKPIPVCVMDDE